MTHSTSFSYSQILGDIALVSYIVSHTLQSLTSQEDKNEQQLIIPYLKSILIKLTYNISSPKVKVLSEELIVELFKRSNDTENLLPMLCDIVILEGNTVMQGIVSRILEQRYIKGGEPCGLQMAINAIEMNSGDLELKVQWT
jgi:hypothetical protein